MVDVATANYCSFTMIINNSNESMQAPELLWSQDIFHKSFHKRQPEETAMYDHLYKMPRICQSKHYDWKLPYATATTFAGNHSTFPVVL